MKIRIENLNRSVNNNHVEIVERKGVGHPDSLADGISENVSRSLSQAYKEEFGSIAHHNTDEVQIVGGESVPQFGGGKVAEPIFVLLAGRATKEFKENEINVKGIAKEAAINHLSDTIRNLDPVKHLEVECKIGEGSADLTDLYSRGNVPLANDTSFGIGHAPLSETEELVLRTEQMLNSDGFKSRFPSAGEDIKVMGLKNDGSIQLTVACAFVDKHVDDLDMYKSLETDMKEEILKNADKITDKNVNLTLNSADDYEKESVYLTVTGTSAEMGDDGSTGRGNRVNGLITPDRPMSLEASSGKNPVAHIGKVYNILADHIAGKITCEVSEVNEAYVKLLSQIGKPIDQPQIANIRVSTENGIDKNVEKKIRELSDYWFERVPEIMQDVINGRIVPY